MTQKQKTGKTYFRTYADEKFMATAQAYVASALQVGFDGADVYTRFDLETTDFYRNNRAVLDESRGNGYWLWKPYCIREKLLELEEEDVLIYNDAGRGSAVLYFDKFPALVCALARELPTGMIGGYATHIWYQARLTKADTFILMDAATPEMYAAPQIAASWNVWRPTKEAFALLDKWIEFGIDPRCINDEPSTLVDYEQVDFQEPRHDQAIFSILVHQMKAPHLDLYRQTMRQAMKDELAELPKVSQFPKRMFAVENMLRRVARERGVEDLEDVKSLVALLDGCLQYTHADDQIIKIRRHTTKHRPTWVKETRELSKHNPQALCWEHANARFSWTERALWKEKTAGKRPEYISFLKDQAVIFMIMGTPENTGRVYLQQFFDAFLDDSKYLGGPDKIARPTGNQAKRELLEEIVKTRPETLTWHDLWVALTPEDRVDLKDVMKGAKRDVVEKKREQLLDSIRKRGDGTFDFDVLREVVK